MPMSYNSFPCLTPGVTRLPLSRKAVRPLHAFRGRPRLSGAAGPGSNGMGQSALRPVSADLGQEQQADYDERGGGQEGEREPEAGGALHCGHCSR
jgi:hypothetical protein